jgi:hypothetical protein
MAAHGGLLESKQPAVTHSPHDLTRKTKHWRGGRRSDSSILIDD